MMGYREGLAIKHEEKNIGRASEGRKRGLLRCQIAVDSGLVK